MKIIEMSKATSTLAEYAMEVANEPVIVTSNGKPIAALLAVEDVDLETLSLRDNPEFLAIMAESRARLKAEGGISSQEMRRRLGLL
jgi:prevent-host-death family protein